jgi:hypothetical protein
MRPASIAPVGLSGSLEHAQPQPLSSPERQTPLSSGTGTVAVFDVEPVRPIALPAHLSEGLARMDVGGW